MRLLRDIAVTVLAIVIVGVLLSLIVGGFYLFDEGYLGFYWNRLNSVYDPMVKKTRCIDDVGELMTLEEPCLILTLRGRKAMERFQQTCEKEGGDAEGCSQEAFRWVYAQQPR